MADVRAILSLLAGIAGNLSYGAADVSPSTGALGFGGGLNDMPDAIGLLRHLNGLDALAPWSQGREGLGGRTRYGWSDSVPSD